jgi:hypothetical protein
MTIKPVNTKFVDFENVKETLATGMTVVHPYAPGLIQIIFTAQRHDPQAIADRRFSEAVSFAVVARIIIQPARSPASLTCSTVRPVRSAKPMHDWRIRQKGAVTPDNPA